jgi:hypothetical protein
VSISQYGEEKCRYEHPVEEGMISTEASTLTEDICINDDSIGDRSGDTCTSYYDDNPTSCGNYDDDDFIATERCCSCGDTGGIRVAAGTDLYERCLEEIGLT